MKTGGDCSPAIVDVQENPVAMDCVHLRGGWCTVHRKYARKFARIFKTWERLKSGLCGWKVRRKTEYSCETKASESSMNIFQPGPSVILSDLNTKGRGLVRKRGSNLGIIGEAVDGMDRELDVVTGLSGEVINRGCSTQPTVLKIVDKESH